MMKKLLLLGLLFLVSAGGAFAQVNARMLSTPNSQTGTTYTFVAADTTRVTTFNNASAVAVTLPNGATFGFGAGTMLSAVNLGAGSVTITCSSCTINGAGTLGLSQNQGVDLYGGYGNSGVNYIALPSPSGANFALLNASNVFTAGNNTMSLKTLNGAIVYADQFAGTNASAKIQAAITSCPATGCVVNAIALTDVGGTGSTTIDPGTKAVTVYLGPGPYNFSQVVLRRSFQMVGMGMYAGNGTQINATGGNSTPPFIIDNSGQATQGVLLQGFTLNGTAGNTTQSAFSFVSTAAGGVWYSDFNYIYIQGFGGIVINLDAQFNTSAQQFDTFRHVVVLRKLNGNYALQLIGFNNSIKFENCEFDGQLNSQDGLTNINIAQGTGTVFVPYDITFDLVTTQFAGVGFLVNGGENIVISGHIENVNQPLSVGTGAGFGSLNIVLQNISCQNNCGTGTTPGVGAGNGAIVNNRAAAANASVVVSNFHSLNTPDKWFIGTGASSISSSNNFYGPEGSFTYLGATQQGQPIVRMVGNFVDATGLTANVGSTGIYNVPSVGINGTTITGASYQVCGSTTVTTPAGTSSTLPVVAVTYNDRDTNAVIAGLIVSPAAATSTGVPGQSTNANQGNSTSTVSDGCIKISAKAGSTIFYITSGYASNPANAMTYAAHVRVTALDGQ